MLGDRFWNKVQVTEQCWIWLGSTTNGGYGTFRFGDKIKKAHRLAYEEVHGPIEQGMFVCHACDNPRCVRPEHLFVGTAKSNNLDRDRKGRQVALKGEAHGMAKNCIAGIKRIRVLQVKQNLERCELAKKLGISEVTIKDVMNGKTWNWLK